jgi:predicted dehydrogenase
MEAPDKGLMTRRNFAAMGAAAFTIVPRHVLGGQGHTAPSDKVTVASIGMGRQGMAITMELLTRPDVQVISVCDCNRFSKDYIEYGTNALLNAERKLLGPGYESWGEDLASPGMKQFSRSARHSMGAGGRETGQRLVEAFYASRKNGSYKGCSAYRDYRELLDKEKDLDGVYIATPDHWHAPISMAAMRQRKHVLCQKPMTHSIGEAHRVAQMAREMKVVASITVNNPSTADTELIGKWLADGVIGKVQQVHNWSSRPFWPQGIERPADGEQVPEGLDWDLWLGPAPYRPYSKAYLPFSWRGWYDFGCGSFGDMGCYSLAGVSKILGLTAPSAVEATTTEAFDETYPKASLVHMYFPEHGGRGPVHLSWYDGGLMPPRPAGIRPEDEKRFHRGAEGVMYVGDKGIILGEFNGENARVYPEVKGYVAPPPPENRWDEMHDAGVLQWVAACKGGPAPLASFETQAAVTETFLLGCLAQRLPWERFEWDAANMRVTNSEAANRFIDPPYRPEYGRS